MAASGTETPPGVTDSESVGKEATVSLSAFELVAINSALHRLIKLRTRDLARKEEQGREMLAQVNRDEIVAASTAKSKVARALRSLRGRQ